MSTPTIRRARPAAALFTTILTLTLAPSVAAQSLIYRLDGSAGGDEFGTSLRDAGDVDGDGFVDVIVGAAQIGSGPGLAQIVSGQNGTVVRTLTGDTINDWYGFAVAGLGDLDGDGFGELLIGAPQASPGMPRRSQAGVARVISGSDGSTVREFTGSTGGFGLGWSVASAGDVDKDGTNDLVIGIVEDDTQGARAGAALVISGDDWSTIDRHEAPGALQMFGFSVAGLGDLNNDGHAEVAVGAPAVQFSMQPGQVHVFDGVDGSTLYTWSGDANDDGFGRSVAAAGDVDMDGVGDVIVGAPQLGVFAAGYARIFSGSTGLEIRTLPGDDPLDDFGFSVAAAGDVDTDGYDDVLVGAPRDDDGGNSSGSARVFSGDDGSELIRFDGIASNERLGNSVLGSVDANGDGMSDLVVGSNGAHANGTRSGLAQVFSSGDLSLVGDSHLLSISQGTMDAHLDFCAGANYANLRYRVLGSVSGTSPGTPFFGLTLPLVADRYFYHMLTLPVFLPLRGVRGRLDAQGKASADFDLPGPHAAQSQLGRTFYHAFVVIDGQGNPVTVSNPVALTVVP